MKRSLIGASVGLALLFSAAAGVHAESCGEDDDWGGDDGGCKTGTPTVLSTPELESLALLGSGATAMAGYIVLRMRARRREQDPD